MNLKITEQRDNPLLQRKEIKAQLSYEAATPSTKDLHSQLAAGLKVKPELLVVKHIYPGFGTKQADVLVYQYESKEQLLKVEGEKKEKKPKEEKPAEAAPAQEKKEEKPEAKEEKAEKTKSDQGKEGRKPAEEKPKEDKKAK
jgi:ribosomal protein S24E